jgi:acyl-CoA reductase-like NAD-dependent aldehyde dehydrogenase
MALAISAPASGTHLADVPETDATALAELALRGRAAQPAWDALGADGRALVLDRTRRWLLENSARVIETLMSETGKTYEDAQTLELAYALSALSYWSRNAKGFLAEHRAVSRSPLVLGRTLITRYVPRGLVGVIGPWNYPLINSFGDCLPALAAGNSVILKPSELTPLTSLLMAEGLREAGLPEDVFAVAPGGGETGAALVDLVDFVMFTGSAPSGRKVAERAAQSLTPFSLELGGKDAMIVLEGADLERAANLATYYGMINAGQTCVSIERVYVANAVYEPFLELLSAKVAALRCGEPRGPGSVDVGAITAARQLEVIEAQVADARAHGARITTGGTRIDGAGRFFAPTVIADATESMACMREETFGPVLAVRPVADAGAALTAINESPYGLGAAIFAGSPQEGLALARRLRVGSVCVNDAAINYFALQAPMGGMRQSGIGVRHSLEGIRKFTSPQTILVAPRWLPAREPQMFPLRAMRSRAIGRLLAVLYRR